MAMHHINKLKNISMRVKNISLKTKIMAALLLISVFCICSVTLISLTVFKQIMIHNSKTLVNHLTKQVAHNLDERVVSFEESSYNVLSENSWLFTDGDDEHTTIERKRRDFSDLIVQQKALYRYSTHIELRTINGLNYSVQRETEQQPTDADLSSFLLEARSLVSKESPVKWLVKDGEMFFIRLFVEKLSFQEKGLIVFKLAPDFFHFINANTDLLSDKNLLIETDEGSLMQHVELKANRTDLDALLAPVNKNYQLQNYNLAIDNEQYLISDTISLTKNWRIVSLISIKELLKDEKLILVGCMIVAMIGMLFASMLTAVISKTIMRNLTVLQRNMRRVEQGDLNVRIHPPSHDEIGKLGMNFNYMIDQLQRTIEQYKQEEKAKQRAEFQTLQAQINPHFLYNTLGSIKWMAYRKGQAEVETMIGSLIFLLQSSIKNVNQFITLREEIEYIRHYVQLQAMRYGDHFKMRYNIAPEAEHVNIVGFLLQPLVENAFYHGIDLSQSDGIIEISVYVQQSHLAITVADNGKGMSQARLHEIMHEEKEYKGLNSIGLKIVNERLKVHYGDDYHFAIEGESGTGTVVQLLLPILS